MAWRLLDGAFYALGCDGGKDNEEADAGDEGSVDGHEKLLRKSEGEGLARVRHSRLYSGQRGDLSFLQTRSLAEAGSAFIQIWRHCITARVGREWLCRL